MASDGERAVVLVEGVSDRAALEVLARRRSRDLAAEGVTVVSMGGATSIRTYLNRYGPAGQGLRLAGLYDAGEEDDIRRGLERAGLADGLSGVGEGAAGLERLGFYRCEADLEDELIRALGVSAVERVIEANGELRELHTFRKQPAQQGRRPEAQLHRFMGTRAGRKERYARLLVEALDLAAVPRPLDGVLAHV